MGKTFTRFNPKEQDEGKSFKNASRKGHKHAKYSQGEEKQVVPDVRKIRPEDLYDDASLDDI